MNCSLITKLWIIEIYIDIEVTFIYIVYKSVLLSIFTEYLIFSEFDGGITVTQTILC